MIVEDEIVGALSLLAKGNDRFDQHQAKLYRTLKEPFFVAMSNTVRHEEAIKLKDQLADDNRYLHQELLHLSGDEIVGADFGLRDVMRQVRQVAPTESPVLLTGETGVGKDVIANAIHLGSPRHEGPFIPVNCGAIPESMLDSELFGHEKGAFTGALAMKRGRFERADKGTILLDEIGDTPRLATGAIDVLMAYDWPGNVRELENVVERAMILHQGDSLRFDDLGRSSSKTDSADLLTTNEQLADLDTVIGKHITRVLEMTAGKIHGTSGAAELLGVNASTLRNRMNKLGIRYGRAARPGDA